MKFWNLICRLTKPLYGTGIGRFPGVENFYLWAYRKWGMSDNPLFKFMGLEFELDPTSALTPPLLAFGVWEPDETELFAKKIQQGMTVVDVGAGFGYYSCIASKLVGQSGKVYAIEPFPKAYDILCQNIDRNHLANVIPLRIVAWDSEGNVEFHATKTEAGISPIPHKTSVKLPVDRLDTIIPEPKIDIIKIDTDGYEVRVLEGMRNIIKNSPDLKLFIEVYPKGLSCAGTSTERLVILLAEHFQLSLINEKTHMLRQLESQHAYKEVCKATRLKGAVNLFCTRKE